nr:hypothetical protein [Clostridium thermarum]
MAETLILVIQASIELILALPPIASRISAALLSNSALLKFERVSDSSSSTLPGVGKLNFFITTNS